MDVDFYLYNYTMLYNHQILVLNTINNVYNLISSRQFEQNGFQLTSRTSTLADNVWVCWSPMFASPAFGSSPYLVGISKLAFLRPNWRRSRDRCCTRFRLNRHCRFHWRRGVHFRSHGRSRSRLHFRQRG